MNWKGVYSRSSEGDLSLDPESVKRVRDSCIHTAGVKPTHPRFNDAFIKIIVLEHAGDNRDSL